MNRIIQHIKHQFNNRVDLYEKRRGIFQLIAPFYHEDGDMFDIFIEEKDDKIIISDYGMTLMRLSYEYEIDTPNKEKIFSKIISENLAKEINGKIFIESTQENIYQSILQFSQAIAKVSNMRLYKREVIKSLFYEMLDEFIMTDLQQFKPESNLYPLQSRDDLEVDYLFSVSNKPLYLFGVKDNTKARLAVISCLEFQKANLSFESIVVHEDFEALSKKDRSRITSAGDKQFVCLDDFKSRGSSYISRFATN